MSEWVFGWHTVTTLLQTAPQSIVQVCLKVGRQDQRSLRLIELVQQQGVRHRLLSTGELDRLLPNSFHQGVIAEYQPKLFQEADLAGLLNASQGPAFLLVLDGIQDPHNLGACLRSANAAGVQAVLAPVDRCVGLTSVVRKIACGAAEITPFIPVTNLVRSLDKLKERGIWVYGMMAGAHPSLYQARLTGPLALVVGGESRGLRRLTCEHCDGLFSIPLLGAVESLNASVAAGIGLFEAVRQRRQTKPDGSLSK